jgi:FAD dependent monooxygenase
MSQKFKAIIVGGSIAGQTLALSFEKANIDYVVLEGRDSFHPELGASVGVFPNGMRVLDQLGLCSTIESSTEPVGKEFHRRSDGTLLYSSDLTSYVRER